MCFETLCSRATSSVVRPASTAGVWCSHLDSQRTTGHVRPHGRGGVCVDKVECPEAEVRVQKRVTDSRIWSDFVPDEGTGGAVVVLDEDANRVFQFPDGAMDAATQLYRGQRGEPSCHQIDPGSGDRHGVRGIFNRG